MKEKIRLSLEKLKNDLLDDSKRVRLQFVWIYGALMLVSLFMTIVNIITGKMDLMAATLIFGLLCGSNMALAQKSRRAQNLSGWLFSIEMLALLTCFIVSGMAEGFSTIWACLLPASGLFLFQRKRGTALCAAMFGILIFFFETPFGNSLLMYPYTKSFMLRFPMLYLAFFVISFLLETIRSITFDEMRKAQQKYEYLYRHDALTEVYNRYGFNECMDALLGRSQPEPVALLILDLDCFKNVNDTYGHPFGDIVLKKVAELLVQQGGRGANVCRWGGEEFAILLCRNGDAAKCGNDILSVMRNTPIQVEDMSVHITASIGIAVCKNSSGITPAALVRVADNCLYEAKRNGRDTIVCQYVGTAADAKPQGQEEEYNAIF